MSNSKPKHTAGTWSVKVYGSTPIIRAGKWAIASCPGEHEVKATLANARLIAAAPEMLEALLQIDSILLSATAETATSALRQCFAITANTIAKTTDGE